MTIHCVQPLNSVLLYQTVYYQTETILVALPALHLHNRIEFSRFTYTSWMLEWRCWITTWNTTNQHPGKSSLLLNAITIGLHLAFVHNLEHYEMSYLMSWSKHTTSYVVWWDTNELYTKKCTVLWPLGEDFLAFGRDIASTSTRCKLTRSDILVTEVLLGKYKVCQLKQSLTK